MKRSSRKLQKSLETQNRIGVYKRWVTEQLDKHGIKVHRWCKFDWDETYYAYFDSRRVKIPIPECTTSLLIALHEIGHIVRGDRMYTYLSEYHAEQWAINTAKSAYNIQSKKYEQSAKIYVYNHLLDDVAYRHLNPNRVRAAILKWIGVTVNKLQSDAKKLKNKTQR